MPGPLWHAEKSEESGRYEWEPVLDENGEPVIGGYTEVDTNPLLEDWNRLDERINQEAEDRQAGDAELVKMLHTEAGVRQEADTFIEAKADTAIQLGNTANAANSRQDGEIATLQDSVKGLSIDLDFCSAWWMTSRWYYFLSSRRCMLHRKSKIHRFISVQRSQHS